MSGKLYSQRSSVNYLSVHGIYCIIGIPLIVVAHKGKASTLLGVRIPRNVHVSHVPIAIKDSLEGLGGCLVSQVVHFERDHVVRVRRASAALLVAITVAHYVSIDRRYKQERYIES